MRAHHHPVVRARLLLRRLVGRRRRAGGKRIHMPDQQARAGVTLLSRKPSRRMVAELTDLLAITPIILGLAVLVANPWPEKSTPQFASLPHSTYGALAPLTPAEIGAALARARDGAKRLDRATANPIKLASVGEPDDRVAPIAPEPSAPAAIRAAAAQATIAEDGRLIVDGETIRLDGIILPDVGATCRRLDGVEVRCLERVAARLSIVTQQGALNCRTIVEPSGERIGRCLAGKIDLAQDLVHARLARRSSARQIAQAPGV
ncbi:MAG: hypothetical protein KDJ25_04330 [Rhodoblastus sp.]|nr:hypothetical protein [Rhodoblastus sp.]